MFQQHAAQYHLHWSQHNMIGSRRSRMATFSTESSPSGRISNGRHPTSARSSRSPCGADRVGILRERSSSSAGHFRVGRTWTPSEMIPHFGDSLAPQGASVCCVSLGACFACFDNTTATLHFLLDICFMVSPSCTNVIVICSVLTHCLCLWLVSTLLFLFPVVCV